MSVNSECILGSEIIAQIGLRQSSRSINAAIAPGARVFEYPGLEEVYVMESDLYGNTMPEGSCFLVFDGRVGLIGKHISISSLINSSIEDIKKMVNDNHGG